MTNNHCPELAEPIRKRISIGWEKSAEKEVPATFDQCDTDMSIVLLKFHKEIGDMPGLGKYRGLRVGLLDGQIKAHEQSFRDLTVSLRDTVASQQRLANEKFSLHIQKSMRKAYENCVSETWDMLVFLHSAGDMAATAMVSVRFSFPLKKYRQ